MKIPSSSSSTSSNLQSPSPMASPSAPHLTPSSFLSLSKTRTYYKPHNSLPFSSRRTSRRIKASAEKKNIDLLGDFGARDPFPAEIESNFADKVLGNVSTEHKILIPKSSALSLAQMQCAPISDLQSPLSEAEVKQLLIKVVGWKVVDEGGAVKLHGLWKVRDEKCGEELMSRIRDKVESSGHLPTLHFEAPNVVRAELWTPSIGGLSMNDFIVAAMIDEIKVSDLQPRLRVWA